MTPFPFKRPCLLLVDDTPANIQILVELLKADYELKVATRGAQVLQLCEKTPNIDLILLDVMMPEMDGYEVCRQLRATSAARNIPIIFLTSKNEVDDVVRGFEIGANDYVTKPFRPAELMARVRTQLTIRAQQLEIAAKNTEMKEMLHIVCHDVANHFAIISMSLELMKSHPELGPAKMLPRIGAASRNGIALTTLVRDLRRVEDKPLELKPVSLAATMREALLLAEGKFQDKALTASVDVPEIAVMAEPCALTNSVWGNLLSNAAKFSHRGGAIEVSARIEDGMACVSVRDHGIGMPPDVVEHLFDVTKGHSRKGTDGERGTGFGMPLMNKFVTQFGGRVAIETREQASGGGDSGTAFHIWLKLAS